MADSNSTGGIADDVKKVVDGVQQIMGAEDGKDGAPTQQPATMTEAKKTKKEEMDEAQAKHAKAEAGTEEAEKATNSTLEKLAEQAKGFREQAKQYKDQVKELDPETVASKATEQGGMVSVGDVLDGMKKQSEAKALARDAAAKAWKMQAQYMKTQVLSSVEKMLGSIKSSVGGVSDGYTEPSPIKDVAAVVAGTAVALATGKQGLGDAAEAGYNLLQNGELPEGVEEKFVEGLETAEDVANYVSENAGGEGTDPYYDENGQGGVYTGPAKNLAASSYREPTGQRDAITATEDELARRASLDYLDVDGGVDLDAIIKDDDKKFGTQSTGLQKAVGDGQPDGPEQKGPVRTEAAQRVIDIADGMDKDGAPAPGNDGYGYA